MKALKDNKVYTIDETQKKHYITQGFDIQDDEGNTIAYGQGKTVPYEKYAELESAHMELMAAYEKVAGDGLGEMDAEQLKAYATEHNIDIGQSTSQDGILKKIRAAQKA
jgi:hypothetical protein